MGDDPDEFMRDMRRMNRRVAREDVERTRRMEDDLHRSRARHSVPLRREDDPLYSDKGSIGASLRRHAFGDKPSKPLLGRLFGGDHEDDDIRGTRSRGRGGDSRGHRRSNSRSSQDWEDEEPSRRRPKPRRDEEYDDYEDDRASRRPPRRSRMADEEEEAPRPRRPRPEEEDAHPRRPRPKPRYDDDIDEPEAPRRPHKPRPKHDEDLDDEPRQRRPRPRRPDPEEEEPMDEPPRPRRSQPRRVAHEDELVDEPVRQRSRRQNQLEYDDEIEEEPRHRRPRPRPPINEDVRPSRPRHSIEDEEMDMPPRARAPRSRVAADDVEEEIPRARPSRPRPRPPVDEDLEDEPLPQRRPPRPRPAAVEPEADASDYYRPPARLPDDEGMADEPPRRRPRPPRPVDDYEEEVYDRAPAPRPGRRSGVDAPRKSRMEEDSRPPRGERVRRLKEVQTEHRKKKTEIEDEIDQERYDAEEEEERRSLGPEPPLPSRVTSNRTEPQTLRELDDTEKLDEVVPEPLRGEVESGGPQFRLPQPVAPPRRSLVQSAQQHTAPSEEDRDYDDEGYDEPVSSKYAPPPPVAPRRSSPNPTPSPAPLVAPKPTPAPKPLAPKPPKPATILPKEEKDEDEAAFLSAARARLRGSNANTPSPLAPRSESPETVISDRNPRMKPEAPKPRSEVGKNFGNDNRGNGASDGFEMPKLRRSSPVRSSSRDSDDEFTAPKLKAPTARKISTAKPTEASRKLAELRATKPVIKPEDDVPEALKKRAALKPPKPLIKPSVSRGEAAEALSNLKPRTSIDHDENDPRMRALTEQLRQLKPRTALSESDDEDEWEPKPATRTDSQDSMDSLNHPTKSRSKGPKRRLPTK